MRHKIKVLVTKTYYFDVIADSVSDAVEEAEYLAEADGGKSTEEMPDHCTHYEETYPRGVVIR